MVEVTVGSVPNLAELYSRGLLRDDSSSCMHLDGSRIGSLAPPIGFGLAKSNWRLDVAADEQAVKPNA